jgi:4-amino-4-deoxy-L-arabinose transferase-like glycosyltransferase
VTAGCDGGTAWGARLPYIVTLIIIAAAWASVLPLVPLGGISSYDEFYTLDRSVSFARMGDWFTVFSGNEVSFRKPPLQYWMTAGLLEAGVGETAALRLPSMLFALGALGVTAWLARLLAPAQPWAMPLAVGLLCGSPEFWISANSAMLDTGAGFFAALAVAAAAAAVERPRWWYLVAVIVGLGALQKAPVGLVFVTAALVALRIARRAAGEDRARVTASPAFRRAAWIALLLVLAWPLLQSARYGLDALSESHDRQMIARFLPDAENGLRGLGDLRELLVADEPWLRWPALLAVVLLPFLVRRPAAPMLAGVVFVYVAGVMIAGGNVYPRYTITILPLLMAALAVVLMHAPRAPWSGLAVGAILAGLSGGVIGHDTLRTAALQPAVTAAQIGVLRSIGAEIRPAETLVYCRSKGFRRPIPGAVSVYASNGQRIVTFGELTRDPGEVDGPLRGVCLARDIAEVELALDGFAIVREEAGYVVWTAEGLR